MLFEVLGCQGVGVFRILPQFLQFGDLPAKHVIRENNRRNARLFDDRRDFGDALFGQLHIVQRKGDACKQDETQHLTRGVSQVFKALLCLSCQRLRLPIASEREMDIRAVKIQSRHPILVAFSLVTLLRQAEHVEGFSVPAHLHQRHSVKGLRFGFFIEHADLLELVGGPLGQSHGILREAELNINFDFVEVAERQMPQAARILEVLAHPRKSLQRFAVAAPQIEQI